MKSGGVNFVFSRRDDSNEAHISNAIDLEDGVNRLVIAAVGDEEYQRGVFAAVRHEDVFGGWRELHRGETMCRTNAAGGKNFAKVTFL